MKANWYYLLARRVANYSRRSAWCITCGARAAYFYVIFISAQYGADVILSCAPEREKPLIV